MQNIVMENLIKCRKRGGAINSSKNVQASGYKNRPPLTYRPALTYRVTQMLTGHGYSGEYLHRIRKKGDRALPPLRCERGFGAAYAGRLSGVDAAVEIG